MSAQGGLFDPPASVLAEEGRRQGRKRADTGTTKVARYDTGWLARARHTARDLAAKRGRVTSDDLYDVCPLPLDAHPNLMGAVWRSIGLPVLGFEPTLRL
jgi:hypothetical protein